MNAWVVTQFASSSEDGQKITFKAKEVVQVDKHTILVDGNKFHFTHEIYHVQLLIEGVE